MEMTLVLNATYEPIKIVDWQRAITLWCQGKVEIVAEHDREVRAVTFTFRLPAVVRLLRFVRVRGRREYVPFTRANIFRRDDYTCQYCGQVFDAEDLTFEHVVPAAQGGTRSWTNIATACVPCNRRKGARTPAEAGMRLVQARPCRGRRRSSVCLSGCGRRRRAGAITCIGTRNSNPDVAETD